MAAHHERPHRHFRAGRGDHRLVPASLEDRGILQGAQDRMRLRASPASELCGTAQYPGVVGADRLATAHDPGPGARFTWSTGDDGAIEAAAQGAARAVQAVALLEAVRRGGVARDCSPGRTSQAKRAARMANIGPRAREALVGRDRLPTRTLGCPEAQAKM